MCFLLIGRSIAVIILYLVPLVPYFWAGLLLHPEILPSWDLLKGLKSTHNVFKSTSSDFKHCFCKVTLNKYLVIIIMNNITSLLKQYLRENIIEKSRDRNRLEWDLWLLNWSCFSLDQFHPRLWFLAWLRDLQFVQFRWFHLELKGNGKTNI